MQGDKEQQTTNSERPPSRASPSLLLAPGKERRGGEKEFTGPRNPEGGESLLLTDRAQRPLKPFNTNVLFENVPGQKTSESEMYLQLFNLPLLLSPPQAAITPRVVSEADAEPLPRLRVPPQPPSLGGSAGLLFPPKEPRDSWWEEQGGESHRREAGPSASLQCEWSQQVKG